MTDFQHSIPAHSATMTNIVQFPLRNKGRVRKSTGPHSEGALAMVQFGIYPGNVAWVHRAASDEVPWDEILAYAFDTLFKNLPRETRDAVSRSIMIDVALSENPRKQIVAAAYSGAFNKRPRSER